MSKNYFSSAKRIKPQSTSNNSYERPFTPAFIKTIKTDKSTRLPTEHSQRTIVTREEEEDFLDDLDSIFINPEEQTRIHCLLKLAREGKITTSNAFDIPVTVLDAEVSDSGSLRFWKFAAELLGTSISIYDKRVQNMFQATHQTFNNFVRSKCEGQAEEKDESIYSRSKRKKCELMKMEISQMMENHSFSMLEVARMNLEQPQKINMKSHMQLLQNDALFQKTLKAFDSTSLRSLFLNIFELGKNLSISFFGNAIECKTEQKFEVKQADEEDTAPVALEDSELTKLSFIARNRQIYAHISQYLHQNELQEKSRYQLNLSSDFKEFKSKELEFNPRSDEQITEISKFSDSLSQDEKFSFHYVTHLDANGSVSEQLSNSGQSIFSRYPASQQWDREFLVVQQDECSLLTPRQLEFRGLKLHKKKSKLSKDQIIRQKKQKNLEDLHISLELAYEENYSEILKLCKQSEPIPSIVVYEDKFLLGKSMDFFIDIHRCRRKAERDAAEKVNAYRYSKRKSEEKPDQMVDALPNQAAISEMTNIVGADIQAEGSFQLQAELSTEGLRNMRTFGLRSIREIKQQINCQLESKSALLLSQLRFPLSSASLFIIFLHLANEHALLVASLDCEADIALSRPCLAGNN